MLQNRKIPKGGALVLAGLAAFAYYKYSKMTPEQRDGLVGNLKEKGRKLFDQYAPQDLKNIFSTKEESTTANNSYGEGNSYTG